jgi:hypothetical protein
MRRANKLTLVDGVEVEQSSAATFERQTTNSGQQRLLISVPPEQSNLFWKLARILPPPYFALYILHTPRGEGEPGRYQSTELSWSDLDNFLLRYADYFAGDARHDIWVYSPETKRTLIWTRHNQIFAEGQPLADIAAELVGLGFHEDKIDPIRDHIHHYRPEFDEDAAGVLDFFDWYRTPLRPEDEQ